MQCRPIRLINPSRWPRRPRYCRASRNVRSLQSISQPLPSSSSTKANTTGRQLPGGARPWLMRPLSDQGLQSANVTSTPGEAVLFLSAEKDAPAPVNGLVTGEPLRRSCCNCSLLPLRSQRSVLQFHNLSPAQNNAHTHLEHPPVSLFLSCLAFAGPHLSRTLESVCTHAADTPSRSTSQLVLASGVGSAAVVPPDLLFSLS